MLNQQKYYDLDLSTHLLNLTLLLKQVMELS